MARKMRVNSDQMARAIKKATSEGTDDIDRLKRAIEVLDKIRANPHIDVDTAAATAKITVLKRELKSLETKQARTELEDLGVVAAKTTSVLAGGGPGVPGVPGGGGGGGGPGGVAGAMSEVGGQAALMGAAIAILAPAVVSLTGAASALVGSLAMAAGGAGVVGTGVMGAAAVGIGSIAAAAIPAIKNVKEAAKAQDAYNKAVQQYGDHSAQAIKAHEALLKEYKKQPGTQQLLGNVKTLGNSWNKQSRPAQGDFIGILNDSLATANRLLPEFATISNDSMASARRGVDRLLGRLETPEARGILRTLGETFSRNIQPFADGVGNVAMFFGRIARFASPTVDRIFQTFERVTDKLARGAGSARGQSMMSDMLDQLGAWVGLLKSAGGLVATFFGAGASQGKSLVEDLSAQLDKWTDWLRDNPNKVQKFFDDTVGAAKDLASALATIATTLFQISQTLIPVMQGASGVVSGLGPGGVGALGLYAGYRLARGKLPIGRAAAATDAAATTATGAATTAATAGGAMAAIRGARAGGGVGRALLTGGRLLGTAALRKAGPLAAAFAAYDFLTAGGSVGNRAGAALNGAAFGIPNMLGMHLGQGGDLPDTPEMRAKKYLDNPHHFNAGSIGNQIDRLRAQRDVVNYDVDPNTGRAIRVGLKLQPDARKNIQREIDALKPKLDVAIRAQAGGKTDDLIAAFNTREQGAGEGAARKGLFKGLDRQLKTLGATGKQQLMKNMADWSGVLEDGNKKQQHTADRLANYVERRFKAMGENVQVVNGKILDGSASQWRDIRAAMSTEAERAAEEVSKSFTDIQREAAGSLVAMGYSRSEANSIIRAKESGGSKGANAVVAGVAAGHSDRATDTSQYSAPTRPALGARIPGVGNSDYVKLMGNAIGAPGELVVNRHSEARADMKLGYPGALASIVSGETQPHGLQISRHAYGGDLASAGNRSGANLGARSGGITSGLADLISQLDAKGFHHGSTTGGQHAPNSYHYRGEAVDFGDATNDMRSLWRIVYPQRRRFAELFGPSYLSPKPTLMHNGVGFSDPALQTQHNNHIHIALAGGIGAIGGGVVGVPGQPGAVAAPALKHRLAKSKGVPGLLAQRAIDAITAGMQQKIDGAMGMGGGAPTAGTMTFNQVARLAESVGLPGVTFAQIAKGESGFNPAAVGHDPGGTRGLGLFQITTGYNDDIIKRFGGEQAMFNARTNALAARAIYKRQGIGAWYGTKYMTGTNLHYTGNALGGRLPAIMQMGDGGTFTTGGLPQLMQVGERGQREQVKVTRESAGSGFGGDGSIHISIGKIVHNGEGDIEEVIKREFKKAAKAIRNMPIDGSEL